MNENQIASLIFGIIVGFYSAIFLLCLSDIVHLSKEISKIKIELNDIRNLNLNQSLSLINLPNSKNFQRKSLSGQLCLSYHEQRQILDYVNFMCNMSILVFSSYSIYVHGFGTHHGLMYRFMFFIFKLITIVLLICLNLHFKQSLSSDILLYIWIDVNCIVAIYRSLRQMI